VFPAFHVLCGLARGRARKLVDARSSDAAAVCALAWQANGGTTLWLANLTARQQQVKVSGAKGALSGTTLDEDSFVAATTDPRGFQKSWRPMKADFTLKPYAVAIVAIDG
jgi:hypothetical protein